MPLYFLYLLGLTGIGGVVYCWRLLNSGGNDSEAASVKEEQLRTFTKLQKLDMEYNARERLKSLQIQDEVTSTKSKEARMANFRHHEITQFCWDYLRENRLFNEQVLDAILDVLELLDKHGDCPSVVDIR